MTERRPHPDNFADLHRRAEEKAQAVEAQTRETPSPVEAGRLLHELQVHQIELEMQNEELQRARAAAEEASEKYYNLFDFAPVGYFLWDAEGHILEINLAGAALLGLDRNAAIQKRFGQFVAMENRPVFADFCKRVLTTDSKQTCEVKLLKDGQPAYALVEGIVAQDHQGQGKLCRAAVIDITKRKRAERELVEGRQRLAGIVGSAMDAIISVDAAQRIVLFNAAAEKTFRCPAAGAIGQPLDRFIPERFHTAHAGHVKAFGEAGTTSRAMGQLTSLSALRADGEEFPMEASISRGEVCGQKVFTVILRDITERKQAEQVTAAAKLSAEQAKAVAEQANRAKDHFLKELTTSR